MEDLEIEIIKKVNENYGNLICFDHYQRLSDNYIEVKLNYVAPFIIHNDLKNLSEKRLEFIRIDNIGKMVLKPSLEIDKLTTRDEIIASIKEYKEKLILTVESYLVNETKMKLARIPYLNIRFNPVKTIINAIVYEESFTLPDKINKKDEYLKYLEYCDYLEEFEIIRKETKEYYAGNFLSEIIQLTPNEKEIMEIAFADFLNNGHIKYNLIRKNYGIILDILDIVYYLSALYEKRIGISYNTIKSTLNRNFNKNISIDDLISRYVPELNNTDLLDVDEHLCYAKSDILEKLRNGIPRENLLIHAIQ